MCEAEDLQTEFPNLLQFLLRLAVPMEDKYISLCTGSRTRKILTPMEDKYIYLCTGSRKIEILTKNAMISGYVRERKIPNGGTCTLDFVSTLRKLKEIADYVEPAIDAVVKYCNYQPNIQMEITSDPLIFSNIFNPPNPWAVEFCLELESDSDRLIWATAILAEQMKIPGLIQLMTAKLASLWCSRVQWMYYLDSEKCLHSSEFMDLMFRPREPCCWVCKQDGVIDYSKGRCSKCGRSLVEIYKLKLKPSLDWPEVMETDES